MQKKATEPLPQSKEFLLRPNVRVCVCVFYKVYKGCHREDGKPRGAEAKDVKGYVALGRVRRASERAEVHFISVVGWRRHRRRRRWRPPGAVPGTRNERANVVESNYQLFRENGIARAGWLGKAGKQHGLSPVGGQTARANTAMGG